MQLLKNLLRLEPLSQCKLLTWAGRGLDREITGITIIEAPDIAKWIKPGTILLTNFYGVADNLASQLKLVKELAEVGAGALFIKVHRYVDQVDASVVAYANELGFPLLELPTQITYTELTSAVMAELFNEQVNRLNYFKLCHERFTEVSLNLNLSDAIGVLSELLHKDIALYNEYEDLRTRSFIGERRGEKDIYAKDIMISGVYKGKLLIYDMIYPGDLESIAIDMALISIILILNKEEAIREADYRSKDDFMNDLLYGRSGASEDLRSRADQYGLKLDKPALVMILEGLDLPDPHEYRFRLKSLNKMLKEQGLIEIHMQKNQRSIYFLQEQPFEDKLIDKTRRFAEKFIQEHERDPQPIAIGIGRVVETPGSIKRSLKEALDCLDLKNRMFIDKNLIIYDELGIYKLLGRHDKRAELMEYIPESLHKLYRHDRDENDNLTDTLATYLEANMNAMKASERMFIHYKTVVYRLTKIKNIAEIDFENREQVLEMEIGLKILRMIGQENREQLLTSGP